MKKNDEFLLTIDGYTAEGSGVGHLDGLAVFVPGGAAGDTLRCHVIKAKKNYAVAKLLSIEEPAPCRVQPDCPVFDKCGGCVFRHISYAEELRLKRQKITDCFRRLGHLEVDVQPVIGGNRLRYRNKAQYPVAADQNGVFTGFYAGKSHRAIRCEDCLLQPEEFAEINRLILAHIQKYALSVYVEQTGRGLFRHIYLRKAFATGEIMVTLILNGEELPYQDELIRTLAKRFPSIKSIYLNSNKEKTNVVLGKDCRLLWGQTAIEDILCGIRVKLYPLSFYQVNHDQTEILYRTAAEILQVTGQETVLDLYCGAGTIGLSMANQIKHLIGVEIVPDAVQAAKENAALNGVTHARFFCADAEKAAEQLEKEGICPDCIIIDPPRKGCGATLPATINRMNPKKILYISCDPATLARDCAAFASFGWQIHTAVPVDLFPGTAHVETIVLLSNGDIDA